MSSKSVRISALLFATLLGTSALAQPSNQPQGAGGQPQTAAAQAETSDQPSANGPAAPPSIQSSLGPYGDPGGFRSFLSSKGIEYSLTYIGEVLGNVSGGVKRGAIYEGRLDVQLDADLDKLLGWQGATFHTNFYQIHGTGLSRYYLANLNVASGIEALPSTRLYELWLEQKFLDGQIALRAGQLAADTEFFVSQTASLFVNATFGWPTYTGANLPSGGPAYPLATPAARVKWTPNDQASLLVALFNGDPSGPATPFNDADPQRRNRTGTNFRLNDPPLLLVEGAYAYNTGKDAPGLPGTVKLGYFHHFGRFDDYRFDNAGLSLADPSTSGIARRFRGNDGFYGIIDQTIYKVPGTEDQGASVFLRVAGSPGDRNLIDFYVDGGIAYKGLIPGRPDDTFGISAAYARISDSVRGLDRDTIFFTGAPQPVRNAEALIEVTYQAQVVPGWTVQPDFQYVFHPGGGVVNPFDPNGARIKNAAIFGARTTIRY
jgi:porin